MSDLVALHHIPVTPRVCRKGIKEKQAEKNCCQKKKNGKGMKEKHAKNKKIPVFTIGLSPGYIGVPGVLVVRLVD